MSLQTPERSPRFQPIARLRLTLTVSAGRSRREPIAFRNQLNAGSRLGAMAVCNTYRAKLIMHGRRNKNPTVNFLRSSATQASSARERNCERECRDHVNDERARARARARRPVIGPVAVRQRSEETMMMIVATERHRCRATYLTTYAIRECNSERGRHRLCPSDTDTISTAMMPRCQLTSRLARLFDRTCYRSGCIAAFNYEINVRKFSERDIDIHRIVRIANA